jgi:hypothetical protein
MPKPPSGIWARFLKVYRGHRGKSILALLTVVVMGGLWFLDALLAGPLRSWAERTMNANLNGYTVRIARVRPHIWRLAFDLDDLVFSQNTHPNPPVANFGTLGFSMVWAELRKFKVAGDLTIDRPALHINLAQIEEEANSHVSLKDRGWQKAVESIYPIKLDRVKIQDGSLLYLSGGTASKPLQLTKVFLEARNVRNIAAKKGVYPSPVSMEGVLFDTGRIWFTGAADFLREPFTAAQGEIRLQQIPLDRLSPLAQEYQLKTSGGFLSLNGSVEYTPETQVAHLREVLLDSLRMDYVTSRATKAVEKEHGKKAVKLAKRVRDAPKLMLQMDSLKVTNGQIGFVNEAVSPTYRLFLSNASLDLQNLSNQGDQGRSTFKARGAFMGHGTTTVSGGARPTAVPADFNVILKMDDAQLPALNGFLKAHTGVDVAEGQFSVYTEIKVQNGRVEGYVKPLIKNLKIYGREKDREKPFGKRVKLHVLQILADLFRNHTTQAVATVARISGPTNDPKTNQWEAIRKLIGNGFSRAILPGFISKPITVDPPKPATSPKPAD